MTDINEYLGRLDGEEDREKQGQEAYQRELFEAYVLRRTDHEPERRKLMRLYQDGHPLVGSGGPRKHLAAIDLEYFGWAYLKYYLARKPSTFHEELDTVWTKGVLKGRNPHQEAAVISRLDGSRNVVTTSRGHAKPTNLTFKDSLYVALYRYKHYIIILPDSSDQAEGFLTDIETELRESRDTQEDFDRQQGGVWEGNVILTAQNIKIETIGSGKKIRGHRYRAWGPDLIVLNDMENDENVNTVEQHRKLGSWFKRVVSKAGDTYTDIMYTGTVLHYDSLFSGVLKNPEYGFRTYQAVLPFARREDLQERWTEIYTNLFDDKHKGHARELYEVNEAKMLIGTQVLWPEKMDYHKLIVTRVSDGETALNSELQNNLIDSDNAAFSLEWFNYYEEEPVNFTDNRYLFVGSNDSSLGKNKKADTSSIVNLALSQYIGYICMEAASAERGGPDAIIQDVFEMPRYLERDCHKGFFRFGVETVQFQYFFKEVMARLSVELREYIPIEEIQSTVNKVLRIQSLQPYIKNGYIKFNRKHGTLPKQLEEFPMDKSNDTPDGLQMAMALAVAVKPMAKKTDYEPVLRRTMWLGEGVYRW